MRLACWQIAVWTLLTGCIGMAPDGAEEGSAEIKSGGFWLEVRGPEDRQKTGWPADKPSVRDTVSADSTSMARDLPENGQWVSVQPLRVQAPFVAFSSADRKLGLKVGQTFWGDAFRVTQGTVLGIVLYHRPAGTNHTWQELHCGADAYGDGMAPTNARSIGYFENGVDVDLDARQLSFAQAGSGRPMSAPFESCGVVETFPEFGARVMPTQVAWATRFKGSYDYDLYATCGGGRCRGVDSERVADEHLGNANVPFIGLGLEGIPDEFVADLAREEGLHRGQGAVITTLVEGGPAQTAGLQRLDVIYAINGTPTTDFNVVPIIQATVPGQPIEVAFLRITDPNPPYRIERMQLQVIAGYTGAAGYPPGSSASAK